MDEIKAEVTAAYILYKYAREFENNFPWLSELWISAQLHSIKMEAQYNLAQNRWIAYLKASKAKSH